MPRPKLTIEQATLNGAKDHQAGRYKNNPPKSANPLGNAPKYFAADERRCWKELAENAPAKVLTGGDRWACETACVLMAKMRRREDMRGADYSTLMQCLSRLALTPVDRQKLNAGPEDEETGEFDFLG